MIDLSEFLIDGESVIEQRYHGNFVPSGPVYLALSAPRKNGMQPEQSAERSHNDPTPNSNPGAVKRLLNILRSLLN